MVIVMIYYFNSIKYLDHDKLLSSKEQSIDNLNKNDVSVAERLEIEHTLSQLEQKYKLNSNTLKIEKIKPKKLKLYCFRIIFGTDIQSI